MKNEVGDKSPNEAALSVLIEGEALTLVPLRSICRGGYHPPERKKKNGRREHPLVQTNFAREKGSRANLLSLLHLFLLSPKSLLRNTFRGPRYRYALIM